MPAIKCEHNVTKLYCKVCHFDNYLINTVRMKIYSALTNTPYRGTNKDINYEDYLGCYINDYKKYIASQFIRGMNWNNYGDWHIDHIIPLKYDSPSLDDIINRLHYSNTQPLWASDNIKKGNRNTNTMNVYSNYRAY